MQTILRTLAAFIKTDFGIGLMIAVGWQIIWSVFGWLIDMTLAPTYSGSFLGHTNHWDAGWYFTVITHSYTVEGSPAAPAFYPLFPALVSAVHFLSFGVIGHLAAGLLVNTVAVWFGVTALIKIARHFVKGDNFPYLVVILLITSPAAIFLHMFYGEAVFLTLGFWSYLFALQKRWGFMAITLAALTAARLPAILFIGLAGLEFMRAYKWKLRLIFNKNLLWFLLAPLGFLLYGLYLYILHGDFLAMFHAYDATDDWVYHVFDPNFIHTILSVAKSTLVTLIDGDVTPIFIVNNVLPLIGLAILFLTSIYAVFGMKGKGIPLGLFGIASLVMFTLNSNIVSVHRYILPCLVIYIVTTVILSKRTWSKTLIYPIALVGTLLQAYLAILFITNIFAG